ncbi:MAG: CoA transferase [Dehalococcoidia bacterium]|jgi:crotonobetainyl-CoA:carnitine CoA-transferase CaiB-like acyl-CoA transferase|nr:CoA transferase [Dehalococcoidia bacterium]
MNALEGIKVVDFTTDVAGPNCTKLLADFGADVVKVEPPEGDPARNVPPFVADIPGVDRSLLFLHLNTNKRSITVDRTTARGQQLLRTLIADADVVVEDADPGDMATVGLDYDSLATNQPNLVYASITPWGQTGPYARMKLRSSELILQAMGGPVIQTGAADREPIKLGGNVALMQAGIVAAYGIVAAVLRAEAGGGGDYIDVSIYETQAGTRDRRTTYLTSYAYQGSPGKRVAGTGLSLVGGVRPCADGYVNLLVLGPARTNQFVDMIGRPDLTDDPRMLESPTTIDPAFAEDIQASFLGWLMQHNKQEIVAEAQSRGILAGAVNTPADLVADPHYRERGVWETVDHPETGPVEYPGRPFKLSATPRPTATAAPHLGQHNAEVLAERCAVDPSELPALRAAGVI